jgi:hypothetical protein
VGTGTWYCAPGSVRSPPPGATTQTGSLAAPSRARRSSGCQRSLRLADQDGAGRSRRQRGTPGASPGFRAPWCDFVSPGGGSVAPSRQRRLWVRSEEVSAHEALLRRRWQRAEYLRRAQRVRPMGRLCECCTERFPRINGLDLVVRSPFYGWVCPDCALSNIAALVPTWCLARTALRGGQAYLSYSDEPRVCPEFRVSWLTQVPRTTAASLSPSGSRSVNSGKLGQ